MRHLAALLLLAPTLAAFSPVPPPRAERPAADLAKMQGEWVTVSRVIDGVETQLAAVKHVRFEGDRALRYLEGEFRSEWAVTLDPTAKPKEIDTRPVKAPFGGGRSRGIYEFDGNVLRFADSEGKRPRDFKAGEAVEITVLQRKAK
jgi:uncharacterized protein (TIGR03067 family)